MLLLGMKKKQLSERDRERARMEHLERDRETPINPP
jgi:hypothetical protein